MDKDLAHLEQFCLIQGIRLTRLRKQVIATLIKQTQPITAYDLLAKLNTQQDDKRYNIMSIYRVLDFLLKNELIHKLHTNNRYSLCCHPEKHMCQLLICENCGKKIEQHELILEQRLNALAKESGFKITHQSIEIIGLCQSCLSISR